MNLVKCQTPSSNSTEKSGWTEFGLTCHNMANTKNCAFQSPSRASPALADPIYESRWMIFSKSVECFPSIFASCVLINLN